jgi:hypothetical protein
MFRGPNPERVMISSTVPPDAPTTCAATALAP